MIVCVCVFVTGFEQSLESRHVMELGEKLASFDIETDTDVSAYPTDTGQRSVTARHLHFNDRSAGEPGLAGPSSVCFLNLFLVRTFVVTWRRFLQVQCHSPAQPTVSEH